jgi:hypothetical protein
MGARGLTSPNHPLPYLSQVDILQRFTLVLPTGHTSPTREF